MYDKSNSNVNSNNVTLIYKIRDNAPCYWQAYMHAYMLQTRFCLFVASGWIITVALLLPVAIINQPVFTSDVATCDTHGMHRPGIYSSYATEQLLYL